MESIKDRAIEAQRNIHPLFETLNESTGKPVSVYDQEDMRNMFEQGANYVLDVLYNIANKEDWILNPNNGVRRFFEIYKQLKK